jgi:molecular chaperone GrpE
MDKNENTFPDELQADESDPNGADGPAGRSGDDETLQQLRDQLLRKAAEFENYRRRTKEENSQIIFRANESLIRDLLPVVDDLERSIKAKASIKDVASFASGIELVYAKLLRILEKRGLTPIDVQGKPFDVDYHDALVQIPTDKTAPGIIMDEIERGYMFNDRVLRHAKVVVAAEPTAQDGREKDDGQLQ